LKQLLHYVEGNIAEKEVDRMLIFVMEQDALHVINMDVRYEVDHKLSYVERQCMDLNSENDLLLLIFLPRHYRIMKV
jgi:hypothetical protein